MSGASHAARISDRDADIAARQHAGAVGGALARDEVRGRIELIEVDAGEPFADPATQEQRNRALQALALADRRGVRIEVRAPERLEQADHEPLELRGAGARS